MEFESLADLGVSLETSPLIEAKTARSVVPTRKARPVLTGPFDRRISSQRRISITGLIRDEQIGDLSVRASRGVLRLSTAFFVDIQVVCIRTTRAGRREIDLTGVLRKLLAQAELDPVDGKSIPLDVYKIRRGRYVELECVRRGKRRPL
ncbi:hypothetical protein [Ferrimicrobium sp.]|uniref:hypothetical protein n=1 Tax=Ferrimicrobium sp. TaxID=2926050 RepID=UPI00262B363C|nr:hypothetical protein [Ferrimicrobium sp.]